MFWIFCEFKHTAFTFPLFIQQVEWSWQAVHPWVVILQLFSHIRDIMQNFISKCSRSITFIRHVNIFPSVTLPFALHVLDCLAVLKGWSAKKNLATFVDADTKCNLKMRLKNFGMQVYLAATRWQCNLLIWYWNQYFNILKYHTCSLYS